ncbi:MAG: HD domain-containing protein [Desulfobacterales bacterium]|nr:HD domain-containing protein [Desulfobacterales bacterium]MBF0396970.1 HD domain-containing protein [Desulfobacterales bacterium]
MTKKKFITDIKPGDNIEDLFILSEKSLSQKKDGSYFLNVSLSDKTGTIKGVIWDNSEQIMSTVSTYDIVMVQGNVTEYRGIFQLVIKKISICPKDSINSSDFVPATRRNIDNMYSRLLKVTESIKTEYFKKLLEAFWNDEAFLKKFKTAPAAKRMHHAYLGGLLEHSLSTALLAEKIAGHYSGIDLDLLLTAAILHDIGKIREFEYQFTIGYSDEGRLLSHIIIGIQMIDEKIRQVENFSDEHAILLRHMIISHHGTREYGSPEPPKTIEAVLLNYIDEIDSKVNGIREFIAQDNSNENWTSYHKVLERYFYIGKTNKK